MLDFMVTVWGVVIVACAGVGILWSLLFAVILLVERQFALAAASAVAGLFFLPCVMFAGIAVTEQGLYL